MWDTAAGADAQGELYVWELLSDCRCAMGGLHRSDVMGPGEDDPVVSNTSEGVKIVLWTYACWVTCELFIKAVLDCDCLECQGAEYCYCDRFRGYLFDTFALLKHFLQLSTACVPSAGLDDHNNRYVQA